jgi:outer membrane protein OmpA-like peptidoglycan-associated protein
VIARANILFNSGSASPWGDSSSEISRIADLLRACGEARARIAGHTDGVGDRAPNLRLSRQRARNVARELVRAGAPPTRVATTFYAWDAPAASPEVTAQDRSRNRRVEVIVRQGSK